MAEAQNCAVIGAGIIGICCGISLREQGYNVTLYDPNPPGSMTSSGNAGGFGFTDVVPMAAPGLIWRVPGWLLDPCGPLFIRPGYFPKLVPWLWAFQGASRIEKVHAASLALSSILSHSRTDTRELLGQAGLMSHFIEDGALTVYRTKETFEKDRLEWEIRESRGIVVEYLDRDAVAKMEPAVENAGFGVFTPEWCNTSDPFVVATGLFEYFQELGGEFVQSDVKGIRPDSGGVTLDLDGGSENCDKAVIAAGAWSKSFCDQLGDRVLLESERGYNTTLPNPGVMPNRQIIFGEEKFVITLIQGGLRIGGAAEFTGLETAPNYQRSERLVQIARRYLPGIDDTGRTQWMGNRPSTPDSLPVISKSRKYDNVCYAFGHSHAGLTMAATTGKLVASLVTGQAPAIDLAPFHIDRFN